MENYCGKKGNKKGSLLDLVFLIVVALFFGIIVLVMYKLGSSFNDKIQSMNVIPTEAKTFSTAMVGHYSGVVDYSMLFLVIGLGLAAFIMASLVRIHPIFLPFYLIALVLVIFFAGIASNIYQEMAANPSLSSLASNLVIISNILYFLPLIVGVFGTILAIVMYKLWDNSQMMG